MNASGSFTGTLDLYYLTGTSNQVKVTVERTGPDPKDPSASMRATWFPRRRPGHGRRRRSVAIPATVSSTTPWTRAAIPS
ncbi:MAG: hypothetical protein U1G05_16170 [Kiritimatiellia bacterium]